MLFLQSFQYVETMPLERGQNTRVESIEQSFELPNGRGNAGIKRVSVHVVVEIRVTPIPLIGMDVCKRVVVRICKCIVMIAVHIVVEISVAPIILVIRVDVGERIAMHVVVILMLITMIGMLSIFVNVVMIGVVMLIDVPARSNQVAM
jgi:hypothetical protein